MSPTGENKVAQTVLSPEEGEHYFSGYANGVGISHTFFDFQFHFSEVRILGTESVSADLFATILMSPQHAKMFLMHLARNMALYEKQFGELKVPEQLVAASDLKEVQLG